MVSVTDNPGKKNSCRHEVCHSRREDPATVTVSRAVYSPERMNSGLRVQVGDGVQGAVSFPCPCTRQRSLNASQRLERKNVAMPDKPDVSELKKMRAAERKKSAMRQLKAAFERACTQGTLQKRSAKAVAL
jgi:hypothetical protein